MKLNYLKTGKVTKEIAHRKFCSFDEYWNKLSVAEREKRRTEYNNNNDNYCNFNTVAHYAYSVRKEITKGGV